MANSIFCKGILVLRIKNSTLFSLHECITDVIERENLEINDTIKVLLERMDQNNCGAGVVSGLDIADYLKTKKDTLLFADLVKKGIEKEQTSEHPFSDAAFQYFLHFRNVLLYFAHMLEDKGDEQNSSN